MADQPERLAPESITEAKLLLVEGNDDERFFSALMRHLNISGVQVRKYGGTGNLRPSLRTIAATPGFEQVKVLGVARDADTNATSAFTSVSDALAAVGLPQPTAPLSLAGSERRVIVAIIPPGSETGALEDLCLQSVIGDSATPCVERYFECIDGTGASPTPLAKAKVHAFLASRNSPDKRLGEAAEAGYWPWDNSAFDDIKKFMHQL